MRQISRNGVADGVRRLPRIRQRIVDPAGHYNEVRNVKSNLNIFICDVIAVLSFLIE